MLSVSWRLVVLAFVLAIVGGVMRHAGWWFDYGGYVLGVALVAAHELGHWERGRGMEQ